LPDTGACACGRPAGETEHIWALHGCATWDDRVRGWKFWEQDGYAMWLIPMMVNHRIVVGGVDDDGYTAGWCYPTAVTGHTAAAIFDPATQAEPVGYVKQATRDGWVPLNAR
jgi:hypothetical protein